MNSTDFQDNKLSNDDLQWFSQIFSQCYEDLVNYARTIVYYKDCAEDVVQEAFIIGIQKKVALKESSNPVGWLYLTVQNVARNKNRKLLKQKHTVCGHLFQEFFLLLSEKNIKKL